MHKHYTVYTNTYILSCRCTGNISVGKDSLITVSIDKCSNDGTMSKDKIIYTTKQYNVIIIFKKDE